MKKSTNNNDIRNIAIASSQIELTQRYGRAASQFLTGLRGIDNETGKTFDRSLLGISEGKLNPEWIEQNIKQQAGYSAEVKAVSIRNAKAIIKGKSSVTLRSEDMPGYGKNHKVVDLVEITDGKAITSQMKFVSNQEKLLKKIACGKGGGKTDMSRYLEVDKLEVPSEQVENMKAICREESKRLAQESKRAREMGKIQIADQKMQESKNYNKLENKISDSGLTTEEANKARLNPTLETAKDITKTSHSAGLEGLKFGVAIGGVISTINNSIAVISGDKELSDAIFDTGKDTLASGAVGYASAFTGTTIKSFMVQSSHQVVRNLSKTNLPAMIVSACLAAGTSIKHYAEGKIDEAKLAQEVGLTTSGMLSASMFTLIGQVAMPIPVLGGLIGGMVGYALTNTFYQSFFDVLKEAKLSKERREIIEMNCAAAKIMANEYRLKINYLFDNKITQLKNTAQAMFDALDNPELSCDEFCLEMNRFAEILGKDLPIKNRAELDLAMLSDKPMQF